MPSRSHLRAVIVADGTPLSPARRRRLLRGAFVIALDGAAERARREGWLPHLVAGDFDAVSKATLAHFRRRGVELLETPDQNFTDLEKALAWCVLRGFSAVDVVDGFGGRVDHSFTNLALLQRFHSSSRSLLLHTGDEVIRFARDQQLRLRGRPSRRVAVLPFPACRASSRGLAYELDGIALELGRRESAANQARGAQVTLKIEGEALICEQH